MSTRGRRGNNEGSIYRRPDGRWVGVLWLGYVGEGGKPKRKYVYGRTRKEAAEKLDKARQDRSAGLVLSPERQSVEAFLDAWLRDTVRLTVRETTFENYSILVRTHIIPHLGRIQLQKLTPQQIQTFLNERHESGLSERTVQYLHVLLKRSLGQAVKWGLLPRNVAALVDPPRVTQKEMRPLTPAQSLALLEAARGDRLEAAVVLALSTGLRRGEILGLRWEDVDFPAATLSVRGAVYRVGGRLQRIETKTANSARTLRLPQVTARALRAHLDRQRIEARVLGSKWPDTGLVFVSTTGTMMEPARLKDTLDRCIRKAGLPPMRFHDLRHSCATLLIAQGVPIKLISEILGHTNVRMTLDVYSHVLDEAREEAANRMDVLLTERQLEKAEQDGAGEDAG